MQIKHSHYEARKFDGETKCIFASERFQMKSNGLKSRSDFGPGWGGPNLLGNLVRSGELGPGSLTYSFALYTTTTAAATQQSMIINWPCQEICRAAPVPGMNT